MVVAPPVIAQGVEHGSLCVGCAATGVWPSQDAADPSRRGLLFRKDGDRVRLRPRRRIATIQSVQCFDVVRPAADLVFRHPEPVHEARAEVTTWRGEGVVNPRSFATARDEPGMFQGGKMARDFGLAQVQYIHYFADADLALPQQIEDAEPGVVRQGFEDR